MAADIAPLEQKGRLPAVGTVVPAVTDGRRSRQDVGPVGRPLAVGSCGAVDGLPSLRVGDRLRVRLPPFRSHATSHVHRRRFAPPGRWPEDELSLRPQRIQQLLPTGPELLLRLF
jgi:hypothetical protein